jgi:hypothetical protein
MFMIETVDEIRHFYQFTVVVQNSYSVSQRLFIQPTPNNQWNF